MPMGSDDVPFRTSMMWPDGPDPQWYVRFDWDVLRGRLECVGIEVTSRRPEIVLKPLKATVVRTSLPLTTLITKQRVEALAQLRRAAMVNLDPVAFRMLEKLGYQRREVGPGTPAVTDPGEARFLRVAVVYACAGGSDRRPVDAVAAAFDVDTTVAGRWVSIARFGFGFLEPEDGRLTVKALRLGAQVLER